VCFRIITLVAVLGVLGVSCGPSTPQSAAEDVPVGGAYLLALEVGCDQACPPDVQVILVHDADEAAEAITHRYPEVEYTEDAVLLEPELTRPVVRLVRSTFFEDPSLVMVRVESNHVGGGFVARDILVRYDGSEWNVVDPGDFGVTTSMSTQ
jgi:hypothetical protein